MDLEFAPGFTEKENDKVLFIFDLNSITSDKYLNGEPLPLDIFTQLVDIFNDIEVGPHTFKYVPNENLIICNNDRLTIEYMNTLKEKVKAEEAPLFVEKAYNFTGFIRHIDIINTQLDFIDKYNVETNMLCSIFVDYDTKTIIIKSRSASIKKTISYYTSKLIRSCVYIVGGASKVTNKLIKYPYRELIKGLYQTDFVSRTVAVSLPKDKEVKVDFADMKFNKFPLKPDDFVASNTLNTIIKEDFDKPEDTGYVEIIDTITQDQIREFFEDPDIFNEPLVRPDILKVNPINYNQTEAAHKVAEALITESKAVSNMFNINDYATPFNVDLYNKDKEIAEFLTELPQTVEEMLDETKAYEALEKIRLTKAEAKAKDIGNKAIGYSEKEPPLDPNYRANMPG